MQNFFISFFSSSSGQKAGDSDRRAATSCSPPSPRDKPGETSPSHFPPPSLAPTLSLPLPRGKAARNPKPSYTAAAVHSKSPATDASPSSITLSSSFLSSNSTTWCKRHLLGGPEHKDGPRRPERQSSSPSRSPSIPATRAQADDAASSASSLFPSSPSIASRDCRNQANRAIFFNSGRRLSRTSSSPSDLPAPP